MKKLNAMLILLFLSFFTGTITHAEDLPIDITAIGRQGDITNPITTRFGAHLFTADAQRVNEIMADNVRQRLDTTRYLFAVVQADYTMDSYTQLINSSSDMALFAQPMDFNRISMPPDADPMPVWIIISVLAVCAVGGMLWALYPKLKGTKQGNIH